MHIGKKRRCSECTIALAYYKLSTSMGKSNNICKFIIVCMGSCWKYDGIKKLIPCISATGECLSTEYQ